MATRKYRLDDLLAAHRSIGSQSAVFWRENGEAVSLEQFEGLIGGAEDWLKAQGVGVGDRVAVMMLNRVEWLATFFAAARIGATIVAVNTRYKTSEVHHILKASEAQLMLTQNDGQKTDMMGVLAGLSGEDLPALQRVAVLGTCDRPELIGRPVVAVSLAPRPIEPDTTSDPDRPVIFFTTSGTTSLPKLVIHSQSTLGLHAHAACETARLRSQDGHSYIAALPFCGVFGLNPTLSAISAAAPVQLLAMFDASAVRRLIVERGITHMVGSDEMYRRILDEDGAVLSRLNFCGYGIFTPGTAEIIEAGARNGAPIAGVYGSSEVNAIFVIQPHDLPLDERLKGGGHAASIASARLKVVDPETGAPCRDGEAGLLKIAAATNFIGYYGNPDAYAKAVDAEGFFSTGDLAYMRDDGSIVYVSRIGDTLRLSGFLTDPGEIEAALKEVGRLREVQVVGVEIDGQTRPVAFTRRDPEAPLDRDGTLAALRQALAAYKVPVRLWEIDEFPTVPSANGVKVQRTTLRQWALERLASESAAA